MRHYIRGDLDILYAGLIPLNNVDIPEYSRHSELVLVFKVTAVTPLKDKYANCIVTVFNMIGYVKAACAV